jgi:dipeptidase D
MAECYHRLFEENCKIVVVHAGLECGIIGAVTPGLDMVSFGPTLRSPHTPQERCYIPSVSKYWKLLVATLEEIPEKQ